MSEKPVHTFPADEYHPHYPDREKDLMARRMAHAEKFGDHRRLALFSTPGELADAFEENRLELLKVAGTPGHFYWLTGGK